MSTIPFPDNWTVREALAVSEFLDTIDNEIWARYGTEMVEVLSSEYRSDPPDNLECFDRYHELDDEIPF